MGFFKKHTKEDLVNIKEHKFKPFHKTYKWLTLTLTLGNLFPNPDSDGIRLMIIISTARLARFALALTKLLPVVLQMASIPFVAMIGMDMYKLWTEGDIYNIIRHTTIVGPFLGVFLKMNLMYYKRVQTKGILDEINRDHECLNSLPREQQDAAFLCIKDGVRNVERIWSVMVAFAIMPFPLTALLMTLYSCAFDDVPRKYTPYTVDPKEMSRFPYFEILFTYEACCGLFCYLNYTAYDGLFGVATNHACLKIKLCCLKLNDAFQCEDDEEIYKGVVEFIEEQKRMYRFVNLIQDVFNVWLGALLLCTMIQNGSLLFHVSAGYGFDLRYALFACTAVIHIFLPCNNAATLKSMSSEMATMIYCSGWERTRARRVLRMLPFLLARAQVPTHISAFNTFVFDMELFVSILRTSYSIYTLIRR